MVRFRALIPLLALTSCFSTSSAKDKHANFHHCNSSAIQVEETEVNGQTAFRTTGCGHDELFYCIGAKCRSPRILAVRLFSAAQSCKEAEVRTEEESGDIWAVSGCGKSTRYHCPRVPRQVVECAALP